MAEYQVPIEQLARFKRNHEHFQKTIGQEIIGYKEVITDLMIALLAQGHVLLEGVPGTAKTTLAKAFSKVLGMSFDRVQFTQDLMPMDITGHFVYDQTKKQFELRKGPCFTNLLLADEINRAPPKTQSAMLETMEEKQVTIEGRTIKLDRPFMVVATMNPIDNEGVYRLPEAQLDRFMIKANMHYLSAEEEEAMIQLKLDGAGIKEDGQRLKVDAVIQGQDMTQKIHMGKQTVQYLQRVAGKTREHPDVNVGASPRSMTQMLRAAQAYALIQGRPFVIPEDVAYITPRVLGHRIILRVDAEARGRTPYDVVRDVLNHVPKPKVVMKK
jgi:MoxR-like ATPase